VPKYIDIFNGCTGFNILTWIKTNPVPFTHGSFLPDTEYCMYFKHHLQPKNIYHFYADAEERAHLESQRSGGR
jgi:hypothetical protein